MPESPLAVSIDRRERARKRAKRYQGFAADCAAALTRRRARRKKLTTAVVNSTASRQLHKDRIAELRDEIAATDDKTEIATANTEIGYQLQLIEKLTARINHLLDEVDAENERIHAVKLRAKRAITKRRFWLKRARMLAVRVRHLKELKEQREKEQPTFEPWMANGADWQNASLAARAFVARAVVIYGLTCTSMARTYVPAGGSTTSWHLVWNGGKAGDAAGSMEAMAECQEGEYKRGLDLMGELEMFGPVNNLCLKLGDALTLAEGDPLENLHDTHVHVADEDSAIAAAAAR